MTNTELMNLKAALEAKQMELAAQLRGRVKELTIEGCQPELVDWIQVMRDRDETVVYSTDCQRHWPMSSVPFAP